MIVRPLDHDLLLIRQPDHARLAARLMEPCAGLREHPRRTSILRALSAHDDGWEEEDAAPIVDGTSGEIADFVRLPLAHRQGVWYRGVDRLAARDPWAAALVAHHGWFVYGRFRELPEWAAFFAEMERRREMLVRSSGRTMDDVLADYPYLRLGDLVSLAFCTGDPAEQRFEGWTIRAATTHVTVEPDLFAGAVVPLEIAGRRIPRQPYDSDAGLQAALGAAPLATLAGEVSSPA
jgi:hypothetical protein